MSGPSVDLEKPNVIGGLDKLVTNFAISAIAVMPTFMTCICKPWRLVQLLDRDDPEGRMGMLLAPGPYFPLALMVSFILAAMLSTPETVSNNGSFIGPGLALSLQTAASEGDVWKIVATIMPIYGVAVAMGLLGTALKPWAHQDWTLRVSLRAAFYVTATMISWMILTTAAVDLLRLSTANADIGSFIFPIVIALTSATIIWIYFWFFRNEGTLSTIRSSVLSITMFGLILAVFGAADFLIRL